MGSTNRVHDSDQEVEDFLTPIVFSFVLHRVDIADHKSEEHFQIIINLHF